MHIYLLIKAVHFSSSFTVLWLTLSIVHWRYSERNPFHVKKFKKIFIPTQTDLRRNPKETQKITVTIILVNCIVFSVAFPIPNPVERVAYWSIQT